jgi:hypothetical protein
MRPSNTIKGDQQARIKSLKVITGPYKIIKGDQQARIKSLKVINRLV